MPDTTAIRCLVVDDEPPARKILCQYISQVHGLSLAGECSNAMEAFSFIQQRPVDLLFLDIRMPQLNGNDLLKALKHPPKTIFTTAYPEYAVEGYELDIVDFLMKPIPFERFLKSVQKAFSLSRQQEGILESSEVIKDAFVYFRADRKMVKVQLEDILYIESMKDYIKVHTITGVIITKQAISAVEAMLPEKDFVRVHRSFIVSVKKIRSYTAELIEVGNTEIPVGKIFRNNVMKVLG